MIHLLIGMLTATLTDMAKAAAAKLAVFAVIGGVLLVGVGFLIAAAYMAIAAEFGAIAAALALGGGMVALGLVALAVMMQRDPGEGLAVDKADRTKTKTVERNEDDVLFDLLVHSAMAGYATGQGDKSRLQTEFDRMVSDLNALGMFEKGRA